MRTVLYGTEQCIYLGQRLGPITQTARLPGAIFPPCRTKEKHEAEGKGRSATAPLLGASVKCDGRVLAQRACVSGMPAPLLATRLLWPPPSQSHANFAQPHPPTTQRRPRGSQWARQGQFPLLRVLGNAWVPQVPWIGDFVSLGWVDAAVRKRM